MLGWGLNLVNAEVVSEQYLAGTEIPGGGGRGRVYLKPVLNWANVCSPEHTSDTSTNYDSFLN